MGDIKSVAPVSLFCGIIATDEYAGARAKHELAGLFGPIELESDFTPFDFTDYYRDEMGAGLVRKFVSFARRIDPGQMAAIKNQTNEIERAFGVGDAARSRRTVNLDPGYVCPGKVVLATTKDFSHRVFLADGIYAEVTMQFRKNSWMFLEWTYPDFKSGRYTPFFDEVRRRLVERNA